MTHETPPLASPSPVDLETQMRDLATAISTHSGPNSSGRLASIGVPALGLEDIHFSSDGEPIVTFRTGGELKELALDAEECNAIAGFFSGLAHLLGFRP